jgi:subtilisin family serine protease
MHRRIAAVAVLTVAGLAAPAHAATDPLRSHQWNLDMIGADPAHAISTGKGALVAVVDSGVAPDHPDLAGRVAPGVDLVDHDSTPQDGNGHGTHVSGIIAADANNGIGVDSVAPGATILPIRVLGNDGSGDSDTVAKGIDVARERGADVINLSLGSDVPIVGSLGGDATDAAIHRALAAGIVVVAAAGNDSMPVCEQPAAQDGLLCVGSVDKREQRSFFSSFGSGLGLVAPGGSALPGTDEDILSTYPPNTYQTLAGTSQATPHVSGAAALLVSMGLRGQAVVKRLLATATDLGTPGVDPVYGHGLLNAKAAVTGLSPSSGSSGGAGGSTGGHARELVQILGHPTLRSVRRHGLRVRLRARSSGRVTLTLRSSGQRLTRIHRRLTAFRTRTVHVRPNAMGRARMAGAQRMRVRLWAHLPGDRHSRLRKRTLR